MSTAILAACSPGEVRAALLEDGVLCELRIWRPGSPDGVGDLHRGRVVARLSALAGAFVALAGGDGFLPDSAGAAGLSAGTLLGVRITRAAQGGKGPRLTARLDESERTTSSEGGVRLIRRGPGGLLELAALYPAARVQVDDAALAASLRPVLGERAERVASAWDQELDAEIEGLSDPVAVLPGGVRASFHPTPALTAIDLDSGGGAGALPALNRAVLPALARQIRLRNLSGAILLDFAGLSAKRRARLGPDLAAALAADPLRPRLLGFTALGLAEIVRPRVHPPLHELLAGPLASGLAALRRVAREAASRPAWAPALRAAPAVVAALHEDGAALADLARRTGRPLILCSDPTLAPRGCVIEE